MSTYSAGLLNVDTLNATGASGYVEATVAKKRRKRPIGLEIRISRVLMNDEVCYKLGNKSK
jgi:hypothetical protein